MDGDLLAGTAFGLFRLRDGRPQLIAGTEQHTVFALTRSAADPARVWMGLDDGLAAIRREGSVWRYEGRVEAVRGEVRDFMTGTPSLSTPFLNDRQHNLYVGAGIVVRWK